MRRILLVANLTLGGEALWRQVRERMGQGPCSFHVLVPATHDPMAGFWSDDDARAAARSRLDRALAGLRDLGAEADGEVGDIRAIDATLDALNAARYDEIIVSTLPRGASRWLGLDLVSRLERAVEPVPVTHVVGRGEEAP